MTTANDPWGRVDDDGTVYVRTADGERVIGSWAAGSPEEALAFFRRKFQSLETEVTLIEQRMAATEIAPAQAQATVQRLLHTVADANCIGDLDSLRVRLEALTTAVDQRREEVKAAREHAAPGGARHQGADRRRGRADRRRGDALEGERRADGRAARGVEGRAARRPGGRGHAVEAAVRCAQRLHQAAQVLLRVPGSRAGVGPDPQGEAGRRGRVPPGLDRLGPHHVGLPRADAAVEGGRPGRPGRRRRSCGSGSATPRTSSSPPAPRCSRPRKPSSARTPR